MKLYIDIDLKKLVFGVDNTLNASLPILTKGDKEPLEIHFLTRNTDGTSIYSDKIFSESDSIKVGLGVFAPVKKLLSLSVDYEKHADEPGAKVNLPLTTIQLANEIEGKKSIQAYLEVEWTSGENVSTVLQADCTIKNDLIESDIDFKGAYALQAIKLSLRDGVEGEYVYLVARKTSKGNLTFSLLTPEEYENA